MKIEQLIVQHLYNSKKVTIQDIGSFTLSPDMPLPLDNEKDMNMPENAVTFQYNKKAVQDDDLIDFIVSQTRKIKPLATSDLESYSILAKQFLNIGKPFPIEGLGVLLKNQAGEYEFIQGTHINAKLDAAPAMHKEKADEAISFSTKALSPRDNRKWIYIFLILFIIAIVAVLYYFLTQGNKDNTVEKLVQSNPDSINVPKDSIIQPLKPAPDTTVAALKTDSTTFKIVIKEYPSKDAADRAFIKLSSYGHKLVIYPKDSFTYKIAMPFTSPLSDTGRARDSLKIFFGGRPYIEMK